jgi:flagellar hook-length control protein FliK
MPAQGEAKTDAPVLPDQAPSAHAPTLAPRTNAKASMPQSSAKDAIAFAPLDAPETPAPQNLSLAPTSTASAHTHETGADQIAARATPAAQQVAREIVRRFEGGSTRFELRLDPPELGRVEVRLDVSRDHRVTAVIAADSPQALTELVRHARELEQMLQGAGLELGDNGLSFDLRQSRERPETGAGSGSNIDAAANEEATTPNTARPLGYERWRGVRVDMMV